MIVSSSTILNVAILNVGLLLVGRLIGPEEFGRYFIAFSFANLVILPGAYGLGTGATYLLASDAKDSNLVMVISVFLLFSLAWVAFLYSFISQIAAFIHIQEGLVVSGVLFSIPLAGYLFVEQILRGYGQYSWLAVSRIFVAFGFAFTLAALVLSSKLSFATPLWGRAIPYIVILAACVPFLLKKIRRVEFDVFYVYLKYSMWAIISSAASVVFISADKLLIAGQVPADLLGNYSAHFLASFIIAARISEIVITVMFPESVRKNANDPNILEMSLNQMILAWVVLFLLSIPIQIAALYILGGDFSLDFKLVIIFALGGSSFGIALTRWWYLASFGHRAMRLFAIHSAIAILLLIIGILKITPSGGLLGAASALAIASTYYFVSGITCRPAIEK